MSRNWLAPFISHMTRNVLLGDLVVAAVVGTACFILDLRTLEAYGTVLVWAGTVLIIFACIMGIGGFASRAEDAIAFSRSGAGNMFDNLQRITDARSSNLGCFLHLLFAALVLTGVGYLAQIIPAIF